MQGRLAKFSAPGKVAVVAAALIFIASIGSVYYLRRPSGQRFEWLPLHHMSTKDVDAYLTYRIQRAQSLKVEEWDDGELIKSATLTDRGAAGELADLLEVQSVGTSDIPGSFHGILLTIHDDSVLVLRLEKGDVLRFGLPALGSVKIAPGFYGRLRELAHQNHASPQ